MKVAPGIRSRLSMLGMLPACLVALALAAYFTHARVADLDRGLGARGDLIVRALSAAAAAAGDRAALQRLADAAAAEDDVLEAGILDRQGGTLAVRTRSPESDRDILAGRLPRSAAVPASDAARPAAGGSVRLVLSRRATFRRQAETILFSLAVLLAGLSAAGLLARRMARNISEPVLALTQAVHELSKGNMDARAQAAAEAELAYLQAGFNAMAAELQKSRQALERQVRQATARMQEALAILEKRNQELEAARREAEAQTELKSRFLAQVSHEIRTPMNGIVGFAELLAQTPLAEDQAGKLALIARSAQNLLSIINDILDLSRLEAGKVSLNPRPFALRPCLEDTVCLLSARPARPAVALWIDGAVPPTVTGDPVRLQQILANLVGNALKFTRQGKIAVRVRPWGEGRLLFSVSDSGAGIPPEDLAKLFSPFQQLGEAAAGADRGSGLGLSIAKNIVESMGGAIRIASRPGRGTSLWFHLPLPKADAPAEPPAWRGRAALVEADPLFRAAWGGQLAALGAEVESFATAEEFARRHAAPPWPDAVLYGLWPKREHPDAALPAWLGWCEARALAPVLLFPAGERRQIGAHQKRGVACLPHPLRSEALAKALSNPRAQRDLAAPAPAPAPPGGQGGLRLLVADDNEINRLLLKAQLEQLRAEAALAHNGREALERLRRQRFDLVFLDLQMPLLGGAEVLRELRARQGPNRDTPAVAVTAFSAPGQREAALREGFADCLVKPVLQEHLAALLQARRRQTAPARRARLLLAKTSGNRELAEFVARKLFAELPEGLAQARQAIARREREAARQAAHTLNGSAAFAGLEDIRQAAAELESALLRGRDWAQAEALCEELARALDSLLAEESALLEVLAAA